MRITERRLQEPTVLELHGMLTAGDATRLLDATVQRVTRAGSRRLVIDLGDVPSIDAEGLGALVTAYGVVRRHGGTLGLAQLARRVRALLVVCRLITVFDTFDSVDAAVAAAPKAAADSSPAGVPAAQLSQRSLGVIQRFLRRA